MASIELPEHIRRLKPYVPGVSIEKVSSEIGMDPDGVVKLASNENPLGASPRALEALSRRSPDLSRYPDADALELTTAIAQHLDVPMSWVVVGAGSESILSIVGAMLLCPGRSAVYSQYSFQAFINASDRSGAENVEVPSPGYVVDLQALRAAVRNDTALVYVANPGNPTGTRLSPEEIAGFVADVPPHVCVLLDEAYHEFLPVDCRGDSVELLRRHGNLVVTRTFSKAYGLAGLRVGYGLAHASLADVMRRIRAPFSVSQSAQVAAIAALQDADFLEKSIASNTRSLRALADGLRRLGVEFLDSSTNFVLAKVGSGREVAARLKQAGVIVRPVDSYGLPAWVRITVGTEDEVRRLIHELESALKPTP